MCQVAAHLITRIFRTCEQDDQEPRNTTVRSWYTKNGSLEAKNYRPAFLVWMVSKVVESITVTLFTAHLNKHHLLCARQLGFKKGHPAADLPLLLTSDWSSALGEGKVTGALLFDNEGTFDCVWDLPSQETFGQLCGRGLAGFATGLPLKSPL